MRRTIPLEVRFWAKVDKNGPTIRGMESPCWVWTASLDRRGYGKIGGVGRNGGTLTASRVGYELQHGPIADGLYVLHRCDNPPCVRGDHLLLGTQQDNIDDAASKHRLLFGDRATGAKLTWPIVDEIRSLWASKTVTLEELSMRFCIQHDHARRVVDLIVWKPEHDPRKPDDPRQRTIFEE